MPSAIAGFPSASIISEIRASLDGPCSGSTDSASFLAASSSPSLRLMRAAVSAMQGSPHSSASLWSMSLHSLSGKSISMYLIEDASLTASFLLLDRNRWYRRSFGSQPFSAHQSAAALCQSFRDSASAPWRYLFRVSGFMLTFPRVSTGMIRAASVGSSSFLTVLLRTIRHPISLLSSLERDQNAELQQ
mgnify:FL=1